jgi:hypothetical protein
VLTASDDMTWRDPEGAARALNIVATILDQP